MATDVRQIKVKCAGCSGSVIIEREMLTDSLACGDCGTPIHVEAYPPLLAMRTELIAERQLARNMEKERKKQAKLAAKRADLDAKEAQRAERERRRELDRQTREHLRQRVVAQRAGVVKIQQGSAPATAASQPVSLEDVEFGTAVKMGIGIALGMTLFSLLVTVIVFLFMVLANV